MTEWVIHGLAIVGAMTIAAATIVSGLYFLLHFASPNRPLARPLFPTRESDSMNLMSGGRGQSAAETHVPPMRIHLERTEDGLEQCGELGRRIANWLTEHEFRQVGQFVIEELEFERLVIFINEEHCMLACIRLANGMSEPYAEFCFQDRAGEWCGVSNPPVSTIPLPNEAVGSLYHERLSNDFDLLSRMFAEACTLAEEHQAIKLQPSQLAEIFEASHAREMDLRLNAGGVSEEEIRATLQRQGIAVSDDDVVAVQSQWQEAIQGHLLDFSPRAMNYHIEGRQILVVHDGSLNNYLVDQLSGLLRNISRNHKPSQREVISAFAELPQLLSIFTPREAIARFRALLPKEIRYSLVDQLTQPVEADLYVLPAAVTRPAFPDARGQP